MAFRFRLDEPIEKGFRRIGMEQIERARRQLRANADPATEIHEARKCMKRIRALLRLGRDSLGDAVFHAENAHFRTIAGTLSSARDSHVIVATIVKLEAEPRSQAASQALAHLKEIVLAESSETSAHAALERAEAEAGLERALQRFRRLRFAPDTFATLEQGLVHNCRKAQARRDVAYAERSDEAFHNWRKRVQTHWRHMALLSRAWPALFEAEIDAARRLSQMLGDDHDLALLRIRLATLAPDTFPAAAAEQIEGLIVARQAALRRAAKPQSDVIFAERPKAHGRRISGIWHGAEATVREKTALKNEASAPAKETRARTPAVGRG
jgi:hypothetical protein